MAAEVLIESPLSIPLPVTRAAVADGLTSNLTFNAERAGQIADYLISEGLIVEGAPPARQILSDARTFVERAVLAELVVRLFRFYILGGVVSPDSPAAMSWLKSYIDGEGHGPLGAGPLRWPGFVPSAIHLLTSWGFEPTASTPAYVIKRRDR